MGSGRQEARNLLHYLLQPGRQLRTCSEFSSKNARMTPGEILGSF